MIHKLEPMHSMSSTGTWGAPSLQRKRQYILVFLVATLSATVVLKIGSIQYLELILAADLLLLIGIFIHNGMKVRVFRPYLSIGTSYAIFLGVAFLLGVIALRQNFFPVDDTFLKKPLLVTISRMVELFLDAFYMLYLASLYRDDEKLCVFGMKTYYWVGIAGCIYSLATFPLNVLFDLQLGTYSEAHRLRGFDNEGGSFGLYLVSVWILAIVMYRRNWLSRRQFYGGIMLLFVGTIGSQSKSAFCAIALLGGLDLMWIFRGWKRWAMVAGMVIALIAIGSILNFQSQINRYIQGSEQYQEFSNLRSTDPNIVMGRVAGAVMAPRMIAEHPLLGIGWGNYPLVRDDPQYRRGTAFEMSSVDAPGLGLIDYIIELGLPLWLYLTWIELKPVYLLKRHGADAWLVSLAMIQPLSNWAGAHLNLTHPWVVLGFALGIGFREKDRATAGTIALPKRS
jgi:hypothetical protein